MQRFQATTTRTQIRGRALALAAAVLFLVAAPAQAVSIYFAGPGLYGFTPNSETDPSFSSPSISVADFDAQVLFSVSSSTPQVIADPASPDFDNPIVVQFQWTVENTTAADWYNAHFVLLRVLDWDYTGYNGPDNGLGFDAEGDPLSPLNIPLVPFAGHGSDLLAAVDLGYIPAGGSESFIIRYNIAGTIDKQGGTHLIPDIGTTVFANAVPEPSAGLLLGVGCVMIGAFSRQRRA